MAVRDLRSLLVLGGWLWAAAIVWLSLAPEPPYTADFDHGDKVGHFLAYAALTFWFASLYRRGHARAAYGFLWIAMGVTLEFAQGATSYRSFELADMAANALGVLAGWAGAAALRRRA